MFENKNTKKLLKRLEMENFQIKDLVTQRSYPYDKLYGAFNETDNKISLWFQNRFIVTLGCSENIFQIMVNRGLKVCEDYFPPYHRDDFSNKNNDIVLSGTTLIIDGNPMSVDSVSIKEDEGNALIIVSGEVMAKLDMAEIFELTEMIACAKTYSNKSLTGETLKVYQVEQEEIESEQPYLNTEQTIPHNPLKELGDVFDIPKIDIYKFLVKIATLFFILSLIVPSYEEKFWAFFTIEYTIFSMTFNWLYNKHYVFYASSMLFFILVPSFKLRLMWRISSAKTCISSKQLHSLSFAYTYGRWIDGFVFLCLLFTVSLSIGAYLFGISFAIINFLVTEYHSALKILINENNKVLNQVTPQRNAKLILMMKILFRNAVKLSIVAFTLSVVTITIQLGIMVWSIETFIKQFF